MPTTLIVPQHERLQIFDADGRPALTIPVSGVEHLLGNDQLLLVHTVSERGREVVGFDAESGDELWRLEDRSLVNFGGDVATVSNGTRFEVIESGTGRFLENLGTVANRVIAEHDAAAVVKDGRLIVVTTSGTTEIAAHNLERALVAQVEPAAVIVWRKTGGKGRFIQSISRSDGSVLWTKQIRGYEPPSDRSQSIGEQIRFDGGTGIPTDSWIEAKANNSTGGFVNTGVELVQRIEDEIRLFWVDGGTVAVSRATGELRWERPGQLAEYLRDGIVRFDDDDHMELVDAASGQTLADLRTAESAHIRVGGGTALVVDAGRVIKVTSSGGAEQIDDIRPDAVVLTTSERYGVVVDGIRQNSPMLHVYDYSTGAQILEEPMRADAAQVISNRHGDQLLIDQGTVITRISLDPETLGETRPTNGTRIRGGNNVNPSHQSKLIVLDSGMRFLIWEDSLASDARVGVVGDTIVITRLRMKHQPVVED